MSSPAVLIPTSALSTSSEEFSRLTLETSTTDEGLEVKKSKVEMCSIGVQTETYESTIDLTLPLWMVSLPSLESYLYHSRLTQFRPLSERTVTKPEEGMQVEVHSIYQSITVMKQYEHSTFEELRLVDMDRYSTAATPNQTASGAGTAAAASSSSSFPSSSSFSTFTPASFTSSNKAIPSVSLISFEESPLGSNTNIPFPLYSDAIQVILRYLNLEELISSLRLSKQWYQALKASQSLGMTSYANSLALARIPVSSVIARHIAQAFYMSDAIQSSRNLAFHTFSLLPHLKMLLPNLKRFEISTIEAHEGVETYSLPSHLETVILPVVQPCNALLESVGQLKQLRELQLCLQLPLAEYASIDYSPLIGLPQLEKVVIKSNQVVAETQVLASLAKFIRHSRIQHFSFKPNSAHNSSMNPLYMYFLEPTPEEPSFPLMESGCLTSVDFPRMKLDGNMLQVLSHYPALTTLSPRFIDSPDTELRLLLKLSNLTDFTFSHALHVDRSDEVVAVCKYLPNLQKLHMDVNHISSQSLDQCLSHLSQLTDLTVNSLLSSIAQLVKYDLPKRLTKLRLTALQLIVSDLRDYILPLQQLETLHLEGRISEAIPDELMKQLRNMPRMTKCDLQFIVNIM